MPSQNPHPPAEPKTALREIGGRIKRLSYADMILLAEMLSEAGIEIAGHTVAAIPPTLLVVANRLEDA